MRTHEEQLAYQREYYAKNRERLLVIMREHSRRRAQAWKLKPGEPFGFSETVAIRTYKECAEIMGCSAECVRQVERSAFDKLRRMPSLRAHWNEFKAHA